MENEFLSLLDGAFRQAGESDFYALDNVCRTEGSLDGIPSYLRVMTWFAGRGTGDYSLSDVEREIRITRRKLERGQEHLFGYFQIAQELYHLNKAGVIFAPANNYDRTPVLFVDTAPLACKWGFIFADSASDFLSGIDHAFSVAVENDFRALSAIIHALGTIENLAACMRILAYFGARKPNYYSIEEVSKEIRVIRRPGQSTDYLLGPHMISGELLRLKKIGALKVIMPHATEGTKIHVDPEPLFKLFGFNNSEEAKKR